jgi:Tol biopolymer transport system component
MSLYIAKENGRSITPMHVVGTNYALSPDGRTVAAVEEGKLVVATVGEHLLSSSPATPGLTAEALAPVWMPDSSAVYFVRVTADGMPRVWRFIRASGSATEVTKGSAVAISPDGRTIAVIRTEETAVPVIAVLKRGKAEVRVKSPEGDPVAIAMSKTRVFASCVTTSGAPTLWSLSYDGGNTRKLVKASAAGSSSVTYGELMPSPNGLKLLFAMDGDDGYSRLRLVPTAGGSLTKISRLRDGYALGWTKSGKSILLIEGNAFQGQLTALWRSDLKGQHRTTLVKGATL